MLAKGSQIGPYQVTGELGAGGMGVVYRARDPRLARDVAIKALPEEFAHDPERVARFDREARLLAALHHPNVAGIHGLEEVGGARYLVLELVEGETLADRLARGPIPVDEALGIAWQIALGLEAAHEAGIVHRDLKPSNIKRAPAGEVKVLDFGLAKGAIAAGAGLPDEISQSPTRTAGAATGIGVVLGTAAYMSPEQARGRPVDRRTDIWSFGCVLYECLTARKLFSGETISDVVASILQAEPDWNTLPRDTPRRVRELLQRCLRKDPRERLRDIGDARIELAQAIAEGPDAGATAVAASRRDTAWPALALVATLGVLAGAGLLALLPSREPARVRRWNLAVNDASDRRFTYATLSHDGRHIAYSTPDGFYVRGLDRFAPVRLLNTMAGLPCWSDDDHHIAVVQGDHIVVLDPAQGEPATVCAIPNEGLTGLTFLGNDQLLVTHYRGGLSRVAVSGGELKLVCPQLPTEEDLHTPQALPDHNHALVVAHAKRGESALILVDLANGRRCELWRALGLVRVTYAKSGYVLLERFGEQDILVAPYRAGADRLRGEPKRVVALAEGASVSDDGLLTYRATAWGTMRELLELDEAGRIVRTIGARRKGLRCPTVSPDGRSIAYVANDGSRLQLRRLDLATGEDVNLAQFAAWVRNLEWTRDSHTVLAAFLLNRDTTVAIPADGSGKPSLVGPAAYLSTEPDGLHAVASLENEGRSWLSRVTLTGPWRPEPLWPGEKQNQEFGLVSPDGRQLAYLSWSAGQYDLSVRALRPGSRPQALSRFGADGQFWSRAGDRLYFVNGDTVFVAPIRDGLAMNARPAFLTSSLGQGLGVDVAAAPYGHFYATRAVPDDPLRGILFVEHWNQDLPR